MRKAILLALFVACCARHAYAQDDHPRFEFFGGYSYLMTDLDAPDAPLDRFDNLDGFNVAATGYLSNRFGITGDFSAHFRSDTEAAAGGTVRFKSRSYHYLAGPQVKFRNHTRATPFVRALAGVSHNRISFEAAPSGGTAPVVSESLGLTDFTLALGGGLDVRVNRRFDLRLFQIEYTPVFVRSRTTEFGDIDSRRLDNVRFSIGVVFK